MLTFCPALSAAGELIVEFSGLASDRGKIAAALVDSAEAFLARERVPLRSFNGRIENGRATWRIEGLDFGEYAISAYHDANANGELDSGLFGIPAEDYGFSNDARGSFGPPDFARARFAFTASGQKLTIEIK